MSSFPRAILSHLQLWHDAGARRPRPRHASAPRRIHVLKEAFGPVRLERLATCAAVHAVHLLYTYTAFGGSSPKGSQGVKQSMGMKVVIAVLMPEQGTILTPCRATCRCCGCGIRPPSWGAAERLRPYSRSGHKVWTEIFWRGGARQKPK